MEFEQSFITWLNSCLEPQIPDAVCAFSFNLNQPAFEPDVKFGIELVGAGTFDKEDPDWPCNEVWEPTNRGISIPLQYSGDAWEPCLAKMKALLLQQIESDSPAAKKMKSVSGVGIGFVDGDLEVLWMSRKST